MPIPLKLAVTSIIYWCGTQSKLTATFGLFFGRQA
jgi:hypothetical protein